MDLRKDLAEWIVIETSKLAEKSKFENVLTKIVRPSLIAVLFLLIHLISKDELFEYIAVITLLALVFIAYVEKFNNAEEKVIIRFLNKLYNAENFPIQMKIIEKYIVDCDKEEENGLNNHPYLKETINDFLLESLNLNGQKESIKEFCLKNYPKASAFIQLDPKKIKEKV